MYIATSPHCVCLFGWGYHLRPGQNMPGIRETHGNHGNLGCNVVVFGTGYGIVHTLRRTVPVNYETVENGIGDNAVFSRGVDAARLVLVGVVFFPVALRNSSGRSRQRNSKNKYLSSSLGYVMFWGAGGPLAQGADVVVVRQPLEDGNEERPHSAGADGGIPSRRGIRRSGRRCRGPSASLRPSTWPGASPTRNAGRRRFQLRVDIRREVVQNPR